MLLSRYAIAVFVFLLLLAAAPVGAHPVAASHAGGADASSIDLDPSAAPANTATSLGSRETCALMEENGIADHDEDGADSVTADVTVTNIPPSAAMIAFAFRLPYPTGTLSVRRKTRTS